jgi:hypothetical protein
MEGSPDGWDAQVRSHSGAEAKDFESHSGVAEHRGGGVWGVGGVEGSLIGVGGGWVLLDSHNKISRQTNNVKLWSELGAEGAGTHEFECPKGRQGGSRRSGSASPATQPRIGFPVDWSRCLDCVRTSIPRLQWLQKGYNFVTSISRPFPYHTNTS